MNATRKNYSRIVLATILLLLASSGRAFLSKDQPASSPEPRPPSREGRSRSGGVPSTGSVQASGRYFKIQVVDRQTGRGVPLVELRTVSNIKYFTDSNGIVAFYEPGLMDQEVFFFVESHGYEFPKDGFGFRGTRLKTTPGASAAVKIDRLNIAERLYRVTGQGIYRDSVLTGHPPSREGRSRSGGVPPVPLRNPLLAGQVAGQDSVLTCLYNGRLFWMWGDTARPSYPLGNFAMSGAVSYLPENGGLDPAVGIDLEYFVDETGFSKPMSPLKEPGLVWLDGLLTVKDKQGRQRMVAKFARLKGLDEVLERGLVVFNDATNTFEPLIRSGPDFLPYPDSGHPVRINLDGQEYYYFATPFPLAVRMRVKAEWDDIIDANRYEVLTALEGSEPRHSDGGVNRLAPQSIAGFASATSAEAKAPHSTWGSWVPFADLIGNDASAKTSVIEALKKEKQDAHLYDIESGKKVSPHGGTVYFNAYRQRWVAIFVQQFGESSFLGEVWYAEADTPVGPWAYARKIVTHNKYSFYNPKQHPYFDQAGGRVIFFEGTYSYSFSGSAENATPRYDYNQIMYRLNLDDPRLALPVAVYQIRDAVVQGTPPERLRPSREGGSRILASDDGQDGKVYLLRDGVEKAGKWDLVESMPFCAIEPARADANLVPVYAAKVPIKNGHAISLTTKPPNASAGPLFYALPPNPDLVGGPSSTNPCIVPLYEYCYADTGQHIYSTEPELHEKGWVRAQNPLCRVWKAPETCLLDGKAKPIG
jgi:hypothetical protein